YQCAMPEAFPFPLCGSSFHSSASAAAAVFLTYFSKVSPVCVRWGHQISRKRRRSIPLCCYNHVTTEIRIHPLLNAPNIPTCVIESVIHHEYLHHILGAHHNRKFKAHERQFRHHREAQEWIRRNLFVLLGRKRSELEPRRGRVVPIPEPPRPMAQMSLF